MAKEKTGDGGLFKIAGRADNPRKITDQKLEKLESSLGEFGDLSGWVVNGEETVSGHQRSKIFKKDKKARLVISERFDPPTVDGTLETGFVVLSNGQQFTFRRVQWDEAKARRAVIAANAAFGEWDELEGWGNEAVEWGVPVWGSDEEQNIYSGTAGQRRQFYV